MRKLLNTLFVTTENAYLSLDNENVVITVDKDQIGKFPLHILQSIVSFSYSGASPALMGACAERNINLAFCSPRGKFLARIANQSNGNVLLRKAQYAISENDASSCKIAKNMIIGKIYNSRQNLERTVRDNSLRVNVENFKDVSSYLKNSLTEIYDVDNLDSLRGIEGNVASRYYSLFNEMILNQDKETFYFTNRNRRPPLDPVNALLSFSYSLLANDCASALESVGLDAYVGFMHQDKPGRRSLSLDLMEELRPCLGDRFVLTLINNRVINKADFEFMENGAVLLNDIGRKKFLKKWQERKQDEIMHPYLKEKLQWGMIPYVQALLLARYIRGDLSEYPPFFWR